MTVSEKFWLDILGSVIVCCIVVGVVIFMAIPKRGRRDFAELGIVLVLTLLAETAVNIMVYVTVGGVHNVIYNVLCLFNLPLIVLLYRRRQAWRDNRTPWLLIIPFLIFGLINFFLIQGPTRYNTYSLTVSAAIFMVLSINYFFTLIRELPTESITSLPMFWINTAMLIYYSGTFLIYLSADYLTNVIKDNMIASWLVHNSLNVIYYVILWNALLLIRKAYLQKTQ